MAANTLEHALSVVVVLGGIVLFVRPHGFLEQLQAQLARNHFHISGYSVLFALLALASSLFVPLVSVLLRLRLKFASLTLGFFAPALISWGMLGILWWPNPVSG